MNKFVTRSVSTPGVLYGVGVGPGDPDLMTLRALNIVRSTDVLAYPCTRNGRSRALETLRPYVRPEQIRFPLKFPATRGPHRTDASYTSLLTQFYQETSDDLAEYLKAGRSVAIVCLGDPMAFGSFLHWMDRLEPQFPVEIVPGVMAGNAACAKARLPLARNRAGFQVLAGTMSEQELQRALSPEFSGVIYKLGRNFRTICRLIRNIDRLSDAWYAENCGETHERILPLKRVTLGWAPYFSMIILPVPGKSSMYGCGPDE